MTRGAKLIVAVAILSVGACGSAVYKVASLQQVPSRPEQLQLAAPHLFKAARPIETHIRNVLVAELLPSEDAPLMHLSMLIRMGSRWDPPSKAGLAYITADTLLKGGTMELPGVRFQEELERYGAILRIEPSDDAVSFNLSALKVTFRDSCKLLVQLLTDPAYPENNIEVAKTAQLDHLARRNDNIQAVLVRNFWQLLFGRESPYARQPSSKSIGAITREDVIKFHSRYVVPENAVIGITGDFDVPKMEAELTDVFRPWKAGGKPKPTPPSWAGLKKEHAGIYLINRPAAEAWFLIGRVGDTKEDNKYPALMVMNAVFGSGLNSRLVRTVRSEHGLSYAIGSQWNAGWDRPGVFTIMGGTKPQSVVESLRLIKTEIDKMRSEPITDDEFNRARRAIGQSILADFDSPTKTLQFYTRISFFDYPLNYIEWYQQKLFGLTKKEVQGLVNYYFNFSQFIVIVIGDEQSFGTPLSSFGPVVHLAGE